MKNWATALRALSPRQVAIAVFLMAFALRVAGVLATHQYRDLERFELERTAISLAQTGVFGNPYAIPTGPTAHLSPGYPLVLAALFRIFGTGIAGEIVKQMLACACSAAVCAFIPALGRVMSIPAAASVGAGLFAALLPLKFRTETQGDWETPFGALGLMLVMAVTLMAWRGAPLRWRLAIWNGLAWSVALLFVSAFLPLFFVVMIIGVAMAGSKAYPRFVSVRYASVRYVAVVCLVVALSLAPWAWRNWRALGSPVVMRDNTGLELRVSNNDLAGPSEERNYENGVYHRYHPLQSEQEARKVAELGEIAYNRLAMAEARAWIEAHPARFLQLTLQRAQWYWFFSDGRFLLKALLLGIYTALALVGVGYLYRRDRAAFAIVLAVLVMVPLPNYLVHVGLRHRYMIDWLLTLLASLTVWEWTAGRSSREPTKFKPA